MSHRQLYQDLAAVRAMVAAGRERVGDLDEYWVNSARMRLESIDELLIRAAGGLGSWSRTAIGAAAMLAGATAAGVVTKALGLPTFWVVACAWLSAALAELPVRRRIARQAVVIARRRLERAAGPVDAIPAGGLADLPEVLERARVRLVSTALREAGSKHWQVPYLRRAMTVEPTMRWLSKADELLCQSIDYLEEYLAADRKDPG
jgi:hypothetical protein